MPKLVVDKVLYPRLDKTFYEVARDERVALLDKHPEYREKNINFVVRNLPDNTARLQIEISDNYKTKIDFKLVFIALCIIAALLWNLFD